jgi:hypothetical protein
MVALRPELARQESSDMCNSPPVGQDLQPLFLSRLTYDDSRMRRDGKKAQGPQTILLDGTEKGPSCLHDDLSLASLFAQASLLPIPGQTLILRPQLVSNM